MIHRQRGTAVIFNQDIFDRNHTNREGTKQDCETLARVLENLRFDVTVHTDFTHIQVFEEIAKLSKKDYSESDCLMIFVLTHGHNGLIMARDSGYSPDHLWKPFAGDRCATLAGKPKLFFIQACRGDQLDAGVEIDSSLVRHDSAPERNYTIPAMADILVMYSTYDGYVSFREENTGSWFIQCLGAALEKYARDRDLLTILTFVNQMVAINFQSYDSKNEANHGKKQIGTIVSTLTRLIYFQ